MKKILLLAVGLLSAILLPAQGVYQLWGMTGKGGTDDLGTIFSTDASGNAFQLRHTFTRKNPGASPQHTQPVEFNGKFYGVTSSGGNNNSGVIFEWDPTTNLYLKKKDFNDSDGRIPQGSLTLYNGKFYGMTSMGGDNGRGVIFEWDPVTGIYIKKIDFNGTNGAVPTGSLSIYHDKFYGMTSGGGNTGSGVIFEWDPESNVYAKKIEFSFHEYGGLPLGSLTLCGDLFYGMTSEGGTGSMDANLGGTIFLWDPATNDFFKLFDFWDTYGDNPIGDLTLLEGKLYGMTRGGGSNGRGVIFEWDPATTIYTVKYNFNNTDGISPYGNLSPGDGKLYGMTAAGGRTNSGVIFEWAPLTNTYIKKFDFAGTDGKYPYGSLTLKGSKFYGMTNDGGGGAGVIFEWNSINNLYSKKIDLNYLDAGYPYGSLTFGSGKFYGITSEGGSATIGTIFDFDPATNLYSKKVDFDNSVGAFPFGSLTLNNSKSKFYGMTQSAGNTGDGSIFEFDFNSLSKKFNFSGIDGSHPLSTLTLYGSKFYGMTYSGGINNSGVIFEFDPGTNLCSKKVDFGTVNGSSPLGGLTLNQGKFYGMTNAGGSNGLGIIFEWDPLANVYSKKFEFDGPTGCFPTGDLTASNGKLYGMTRVGGKNNAGVIFEWNPITNEYIRRFDLNDIDGANPFGSLTYSAGRFYGMTYAGGINGTGVLFEWDPVTNLYTKKNDFYGTNGNLPNLCNNLTLAPAPVAKGLSGSCISFPSITINSSNNNQWVSITDENGNAVAEIKANGNNLGVVTSSMFINNAAVRQDAAKRLYLDRNITITPQVQPTTAVDIRLYIKGTEYEALKNAVNSNGQSAGINSIGDITLYKVSGSCSPAVSTLTNKVTATAAAWEADYVFTASITSFSSFYFAGKATVCSAPVITQVHANPASLWPPNHQLKNVTVSYNITGTCTPITSWLTVSSNEPSIGTGCGDIAPDWVIVNNHQLKLRAERSGHGNGRIYTICINAKDAAGNIATQKTNVKVPHNQGCSNSKGSYNSEGYINANGDYFDQWFDCTITPNPSTQSFNLQVATASSEKIDITIFDLSGRLIKKLTTLKNQFLRFGDELKPGMYMVTITQGQQQQIKKVVKQ